MAINVLFIAHSADLYGAEKSLLDLLVSLPPDIQPFVILPSCGPFSAKLDEARIPYEIVPFRRWIGSRFVPLQALGAMVVNHRAVAAVRSMIRRHAIDIVYTNTLGTAIGAQAAHQAGRPHIWHIREFIGRKETAQFLFGDRHSMRFVNMTTGHVIYNSEAIAAHYSLLGISVPGSVVYNGFGDTVSALLPLPQASVLAVNSLSPTKNIEELIEAASILKQRGRKLTITIAGNGRPAYRRHLEKMIGRRGLSEIIRLMGFVADTGELYRQATLLVLCAKESFGRVLVEAMACGCPVLAPRTGGALEIIHDNETGFLYEPGNSNDLAAKIGRVLDTSGELDHLRLSAQMSVSSRFPMSDYVNGISDIIRRTRLASDRSTGVRE
ncbi:MAG: glycosyltransferase [Chitinispirillaceae bacterium]|jgi:glycosyltransferase involved in cell wall biosynthesis|nr:glycosyltransferase [Chitinispirillaceae bacterium]